MPPPSGNTENATGSEISSRGLPCKPREPKAQAFTHNAHLKTIVSSTSHCPSHCSVGFRLNSLRTYWQIRPSTMESSILAIAPGVTWGLSPSLSSAPLRTCLIWVSSRSNSLKTLCLRRSGSPARASPVRIRVKPGFSHRNRAEVAESCHIAAKPAALLPISD